MWHAGEKMRHQNSVVHQYETGFEYLSFKNEFNCNNVCVNFGSSSDEAKDMKLLLLKSLNGLNDNALYHSAVKQV